MHLSFLRLVFSVSLVVVVALMMADMASAGIYCHAWYARFKGSVNVSVCWDTYGDEDTGSMFSPLYACNGYCPFSWDPYRAFGRPWSTYYATMYQTCPYFAVNRHGATCHDDVHEL